MKRKLSPAFAVLLVSVIAAIVLPGDAGRAQLPPPPNCNVIGYSCATLHVYQALQDSRAGSGRATSTPAGIDCTFAALKTSGACVHQFEWPATNGDLTVVVTPTPATGSVVVPPGPRSVTLRHGQSLHWGLLFMVATYELTVTKSGAGTGAVTSIPSGIACGTTCKWLFYHGTDVRLNATPDAGAVFRGWTGACAGQDESCPVTVTQATSTNAVFELASAAPPPPPPSPLPPPPPPADPEVDREIEADLVAKGVGRSRLGARVVQVELELGEDVAATLTLARAKKTLATRQVTRVREGSRVLTLAIPTGVRKGAARLGLELRDAVGNKKAWSAPMRIPPLSPKRRSG